MLGNSTRSLLLHQKQLLYRTCVLLITLYSFPLWYYNKASLLYSLKKLRKMQHRAALWILGAFHTSPTLENKAIASLISIHLHLQKLSRRHQFRMSSLSPNYTVKSLLENRHANNSYPHYLSLENMTSKQRLKIKSSVVNTNNYLNGIFSLFNSLDNEIFS